MVAKFLKYFSIAVFLFALLESVDLAAGYSATATPRYSFYLFFAGNIIRSLVDVLMIYLLCFLSFAAGKKIQAIVLSWRTPSCLFR